MSSNTVLNLAAVENYFKKAQFRLKKGRDAVKSGHLMDCRIDRQAGLLWGVVQASMKTTCYNVQTEFTPSKIIRATCSCPIGEHGLCHHIAGITDYAANNISCTDTACQWSFKSKAGHGNEGLPIDTFYLPSKPDYNAIPGPLCAEEVREAHSKLCTCMGGAGGVKWLTDPEPPAGTSSANIELGTDESLVSIPSMEDAILSPGFAEAEDELEYCTKYFNLSQDEIVNIAENTKGQTIAENTKGQTKNSNWFKLRRHRISASIFGKTLTAARSKRSCTNLVSQISGTGKSRYQIN